jgi:trehalose 6-phosphate phosphatase
MSPGGRASAACAAGRLPGPESCAPERCAYFLDLDGTLLEIAQRPAAVRVDPELSALIADLHAAAGGAVALVSGRAIADIDRLLHLPHLPIAGQHGAERRNAAGRTQVHEADERALALLRAQVQSWRALHPELLVEDKGLAIALHYRSAPELGQTLARLARAAIAGLNGYFQMQSGKLVLEFKPAGRDKGRAVDEFLSEPPFAGRLPVFVGDDVTDEHGFAAVNARGGVSVKVGDGATIARRRLESVDAVHRWLRSALA